MLRICVVTVFVTVVAACLYDGVQHQPGDVWEAEYDVGRFIECTCPEVLPANVSSWLESDYCQDMCVVAGTKYRAGETWATVNSENITEGCKCEANGEPLCVDEGICRYKKHDYDTGTSWIVDIKDGRKMRCECPAVPIPKEDWTAAKYCTAFCDDDGTIHQPGESWKLTRNGFRFECKCNDHGAIHCQEIKRCQIGGVTHAKGDTWIQEVSGGRQKECTCPTRVKFNRDTDCKAICIVNGTMYRPEDKFEQVDSITGLTLYCQCSTYGNVQCYNLDPDLGCRVQGQVYPRGQKFILTVDDYGSKKECDCPANVAPGTVWNADQMCTDLGCRIQGRIYPRGQKVILTVDDYGHKKECDCPTNVAPGTVWRAYNMCTGLCFEDGVKYYSRQGFKKVDPDTGRTISCLCLGHRIRCNLDSLCIVNGTWYKPGDIFLTTHPTTGRTHQCYCQRSEKPKCRAVCLVNGTLIRGGTTFDLEDRNTGRTVVCRCEYHGVVKCEGFKGCRAGGQLHLPGQTFILDLSDGRRKECDCPALIPPGTSWSPSQYCKPVCILNGATHYGGTTFDVANITTGQTVQCECKSHGVLRC